MLVVYVLGAKHTLRVYEDTAGWIDNANIMGG